MLDQELSEICCRQGYARFLSDLIQLTQNDRPIFPCFSGQATNPSMGGKYPTEFEQLDNEQFQAVLDLGTGLFTYGDLHDSACNSSDVAEYGEHFQLGLAITLLVFWSVQ
jgi:hypothetical protein